VNPSVKINEVSVKVFAVVFPCLPVNSRRCVPFQLKENTAEAIDGDVVQKRCQLLGLVSGCSFTYARLRL
jgi:hypothetical protein